MNHIAQSEKSFEEVLEILKAEITANGFRLLHIHDLKKTLGEKGFEIENYSILEICNAAFAYQLLSEDKEFGSMLPCRINLYEQRGKVWISTLLPTELIERFEMPAAEEIAKKVEVVLKKIIDSSI
jgi:uncharacterized protein (DUF302 family)